MHPVPILDLSDQNSRLPSGTTALNSSKMGNLKILAAFLPIKQLFSKILFTDLEPGCTKPKNQLPFSCIRNSLAFLLTQRSGFAKFWPFH